MSANRTDSGPPSSCTWSAGSASVNDVALELEACLCIEEGDEFSFVHPPSIVSSHEQLTTCRSATGGESLYARPASHAASLPGFMQGGSVRGMIDTP